MRNLGSGSLHFIACVLISINYFQPKRTLTHVDDSIKGSYGKCNGNYTNAECHSRIVPAAELMPQIIEHKARAAVLGHHDQCDNRYEEEE